MIATLRLLSTVIERIAIVANAVGTLVVLGLVMVVNYDVIAREAFNAPFHGAVELVQFSMVLIVFLQLPDVVRVNRLTRSDGFLTVIGSRMPRLRLWTNRFIYLLAFLFMLLSAVAIWPEFLEMLETEDYFGVPGVFTAPWWPVKLVIFSSASMCAILFLLKLVLPPEERVKSDITKSASNVDPDGHTGTKADTKAETVKT